MKTGRVFNRQKILKIPAGYPAHVLYTKHDILLRGKMMVVSTAYDFEAIQEAVQARSPGITVISLDDLTGLRF